MDPTLSRDGLARRDFALAIGALAAGAILAPSAPAADEPKPAVKPPSLAELQEQIVRTRFGSHLNEEQIKKLAQRVNAQRGTSEALKKIPLKNSDEPAFIFSAE